ncbi:MAG: hypothetical protein GEU90_09365 [Gemmatimonas sp.]|nr:hypothetical protein [Gemmatimonas sp.]
MFAGPQKACTINGIRHALMRRPGRFERRLLLALALFSLVPSLLVVGVGTFLLRETVSLQATPAGWERLAESGQALLERAEASGDSALLAASARHREELSVSVLQAQRWGYVNRRILDVLPWVAATFLGLLGILAVRSARGIARELARPINELVGWSGRVARSEPLPSPDDDEFVAEGEFAILRASFRTMETELEVSRQRALESARIRSSVALARGVAHELKNALTPLTLGVRTLKRKNSWDPEERETLEVIEAESARLEALARAFSQFGRPPEGTPSTIDVGELLDHVASTHLPHQVEYTLQVEKGLPEIHGYYDPLSRVFANLVLNASEAVGEDGGDISIDVRRTADEEVEVCIVDSGPGIQEEALPRIWDPDFTTKARGTGLGLALVQSAVHAHGGRVAATNRAGRGAEFRVVLPINGVGTVSSAPPPATAQTGQPGPESVAREMLPL